MGGASSGRSWPSYQGIEAAPPDSSRVRDGVPTGIDPEPPKEDLDAI